MPKALITGCGGQDGSFLAEILLEDGYEVHGLVRQSSSGSLHNLYHLLDRIRIYKGDVTDPIFMAKLIYHVAPDEIYHEADQDNVGHSFETPGYSVDVTVKAVTNLLETVKNMGSKCQPKIFLPSSATIFGNATAPQNEESPLNPQSPYAIGKAAVLHLGNYYRSIHGLKIVTGILYNHDSARRNGSYLLHDICRIALDCVSGKRVNTGSRFSNIHCRVNIGEARKYMDVVVRLMRYGCYDNFVIGTSLTLPVESWIQQAFFILRKNYREFLIEAEIPQRPGLPEDYRPDISKLRSVIDLPDIRTDQYNLVLEILRKYRKESL